MKNSEVLGHEGASNHLSSVSLQENIKGLFIDKIKFAVRSGVRSIASGAIDHSLACV
jgi:hypothetical protein